MSRLATLAPRPVAFFPCVIPFPGAFPRILPTGLPGATPRSSTASFRFLWRMSPTPSLGALT